MPEWGVQTPVSSIRPTPAMARAQAADFPWATYYKYNVANAPYPFADRFDLDTPVNNVYADWILDDQSTNSGFAEWTDDRTFYVETPGQGIYYYELYAYVADQTISWAVTPAIGEKYLELVGTVFGGTATEGFVGVGDYHKHVVNGENGGSFISSRYYSGFVEQRFDPFQMTANMTPTPIHALSGTGNEMYVESTLFICQVSEATF